MGATRRSPRRVVRSLAGLALALLCCGASVAGTPAPDVEYLYIDANEGSASGGHVALRIGDRVYHLQRDAVGALVLRREPWTGFAFQYRVVENRSLSATRLDLDREQAERLRERLDREVILEDAEARRLAALRRDLALLEALASSPEVADRGVPMGGADRGLPMEGAGFFARGRRPATRPEAAGVLALRGLAARIQAEHGAEFLAERSRRTTDRLRALDPESSELPGDRGPLAVLGARAFSTRYDDLFAAALAVDLLREAPPLRRSALASPPERVAALSAPERDALATRLTRLEADLVRLAASTRPDWGRALVLGMARLAALAESLESGELRVLDAFPAEPAGSAPAIEPATLERARAQRIRRRTWRSQQLAAARARFSAQPSERSQARLEASVGRLAELEGALQQKRPLRLPARLEARGEARVRALPWPGLGPAELAAALERARGRLHRALDARVARSRYDLVRHNCVTELLLRIDGALPASARLAEEGPLVFVPFVSEEAVRARWPEGDRRSLLSLRREMLQGGDWRVALRESNVLTSTLYTPHPADSSFLFFTDEPLALRPLLGAVNLAAGLLGAVGGVLTLPFDGGALLARGLRGSAASLPELFFVNIRKGTFPLQLPPGTPRADRDLDGRRPPTGTAPAARGRADRRPTASRSPARAPT